MHDVPDMAGRHRIPGPRTHTEGTGPPVVVPGIGIGHIVQAGHPRVIEIGLGAPAATVIRVEEADGPRVDVLADPDVPADRLAAVVESARLLHVEPAPAPSATLKLPVQRRRRLGPVDGRRAVAGIVAIAGAAATVAGLFAGASDRDVLANLSHQRAIAVDSAVEQPAAL